MCDIVLDPSSSPFSRLWYGDIATGFLVHTVCTMIPSHWNVSLVTCNSGVALQWRHNGLDGVWNHQPYHCLLGRLFGARSKKTPKLRVTGLCADNSPSRWIPTQMASNAENVSIWWRHHGIQWSLVNSVLLSIIVFFIKVLLNTKV